MLKKLYILSILIGFTLVSCETEFNNTYIIKNDTKYRIKIKGFDKIGAYSKLNDTTMINSEEIMIEPFGEYKTIKSAGYHSETQGIFNSAEIDSLSISFDNIKQITYSCKQPTIFECEGKYNLVNYKANYKVEKTGKSSGKDEYTYSYSFKEIDYSLADSIK
jgi:hypothetical protein